MEKPPPQLRGGILLDSEEDLPRLYQPLFFLHDQSGAFHADNSHRGAGGQLGGPDTVADLTRFLLSAQGAWIRGQLLLSNGGFATPAG